MYDNHPDYQRMLDKQEARKRLISWGRKVLGELAFCVPTCLAVHWVLEKFQ